MSTNKTAISESILAGKNSESAITSALTDANAFVIAREKKGKQSK